MDGPRLSVHGRREGDDRAPRCLERQGQARAGLAASAPELARGIRDVSDELLKGRRLTSFAIAHRMLGTVVEAEDVIQEARLRCHRSISDGERVPEPITTDA